MDLDSHEEMLEQLMTVLVEIEEKFKNQKEGSEVRFEDFVMRILELTEEAA